MSGRPGTDVGETVVATLTEVARALEEPAGRSRFLRGLAIGALVGAAVVGGLLGMGTRRRRDRPPTSRVGRD